MTELRKNPLSQRWVIFSTLRAKRPSDFRKPTQNPAPPSSTSMPGSCAFCLGHEHETGSETLAFRFSDVTSAPDWRVRVVMNIFPALSCDPVHWNQGSEGPGVAYEGCLMKGLGSHEVVIETPDHSLRFHDLPHSHVEEVLRAFKLRVLHFRDEGRFQYCQIFKNEGGSAGASMRHSHSQLISLPIVPKDVADEILHAKTFFEQHHQCQLCDIIGNEVQERNRIVGLFTDFVILSPFAASFPYETWIIPLKHSSNFEDINEEEVQSLAVILKSVVIKLNELFDFPPYNYAIQTAPLQGFRDAAYFHWYIRIIPHLTTTAGFELATGCNINSVFPEEAAKVLRINT